VSRRSGFFRQIRQAQLFDCDGLNHSEHGDALVEPAKLSYCINVAPRAVWQQECTLHGRALMPIIERTGGFSNAQTCSRICVRRAPVAAVAGFHVAAVLTLAIGIPAPIRPGFKHDGCVVFRPLAVPDLKHVVVCLRADRIMAITSGSRGKTSLTGSAKPLV